LYITSAKTSSAPWIRIIRLTIFLSCHSSLSTRLFQRYTNKDGKSLMKWVTEEYPLESQLGDRKERKEVNISS